MAQPYVGEIRMFGGNFAPAGWLFCDGSLLAIAENDTLFNLIGTMYGGDGQATFALPDLRSRVPIHMGSGFVIGESGGVESVTLTVNQIPLHSHPPMASSTGGATTAANNVWANSAAIQFIEPTGITGLMNPGTAALNGGNQPHDNMIPFVGINYIISLYGIFPSPT